MITKIVIVLALTGLLTSPPGAAQERERAGSPDLMIARMASATIRITDPTDGPSPSPPETAVAVRATAASAAELEWLELWANDRLVGVQPAPKGGLKTLTGVFAWTPEAAGTYSLVARAVDGEGRTATSTAVDVTVAAAAAPRAGPDKEATKGPVALGNGVGSERTLEPATFRLASAGQRTDAIRDAVAAERWQRGTPGRRSGPRPQSRPETPVLTASTEPCQVTLSMRDSTGRADGYAVYRQSPAGMGWTRVAVLHAAAGKGLSFTDGAPPGRLHYYVTAFNERGETPSNPVALDVDCGRAGTQGGARPVLKHQGPPIQEHPDQRMPKVDAKITHSVDQCKQHLPGKGTNALEAILFCTPFPEYNDEGEQVYLVWSTDDGVCANGKAGRGVDCKGLDYYLSRADTYGGHVGFRLAYTHNDGPIAGVGYPCIVGDPCTATTGYDHTSYVVPPLEPYDPSADQFNLCGSEVEYTVELVYDAGPNDPEFANFLMVGPLKGAADWRFDCPPAPAFTVTGEQLLDVRIGTLHLGDVDDGDSGDLDDVEVYGFFRVWTANVDVPVPALVLQSGTFKKVGFRKFGTWGEPPGDCFTEAFELPTTLHSASGGECHRSLREGDHPVSEFLLCDSCSSPYDNDGPWSQNKNTIRIAVREGEAVYIETLVMDYDSGSADDAQCVGVVNTERHLLETWSKADTPLTMTQKNNGNSSCSVTFRIVAVP